MCFCMRLPGSIPSHLVMEAQRNSRTYVSKRKSTRQLSHATLLAWNPLPPTSWNDVSIENVTSLVVFWHLRRYLLTTGVFMLILHHCGCLKGNSVANSPSSPSF